VTQGVGPEYKPQYHKKKKKERKARRGLEGRRQVRERTPVIAK
jgi:hypothetical protein